MVEKTANKVIKQMLFDAYERNPVAARYADSTPPLVHFTRDAVVCFADRGRFEYVRYSLSRLKISADDEIAIHNAITLLS
jgi:hypothetical protein